MLTCKQPICLVANKENGLQVQSDALEQLASITDKVDRCVVVGIIGPVDSGKSYLLNQLFLSEKDYAFEVLTGFTVGHRNVNKETGLWASWSPHPKQKDAGVVFLDMQGSSLTGDLNWIWMASLICHFSSVLIYNNGGVASRVDLEKLNDILRTTANIKAIFRHGKREVVKGTSHLFFAIRDFGLELTSSPTDYLHDILEPRQGEAGAEKAKERIREYFSRKNGFKFPFPVRDSSRLDSLPRLPTTEIIPGFTESVDEFGTSILEVTGEQLRMGLCNTIQPGIVEEIVAAVQSGFITPVKNAWQQDGAEQDERYSAEKIQDYRDTLDRLYNEDVYTKFQDGLYFKSDGYRLFCRDVDNFKEKFHQIHGTEQDAQEILLEFLDNDRTGQAIKEYIRKTHELEKSDSPKPKKDSWIKAFIHFVTCIPKKKILWFFFTPLGLCGLYLFLYSQQD